tara:strand:+ start:1085 stop:1723 length:639 start_codon:yes stop_codon:yes gene_type:complete
LNNSNYLKLKSQLPKTVNLLAVSKYTNTKNILNLYNSGQEHFGESKVQDALIKQANLKDNKKLMWHFIGKIQSNKIIKIVKNFDYIHSVDSLKKLEKISKIAIEINKEPKIMIQIKLSDDPDKGGMEIEELISKFDEIKSINGIQLIGLMTMNPKGLSSTENLKLFKQCRSLADSLSLKDCSMGMSQDWREAIEAGSTWIRLGSLIFGDKIS